MRYIDAHIHFNSTHPEALSVMDRLGLKLLNICVAGKAGEGWRKQAETYQNCAKINSNHFSWCTTFSLPRFNDPQYTDSVIAGLQRDFAAGALACKIWKNIGMEVKKPDGTWFTVDDHLFDPILSYIEKCGKPVLMHIAEPLACWKPLEPGKPHYGYYNAHPEWHMYNKPQFLSHEALIASRDRVVARWPNIHFIGAHLASLEFDVDELAKRLKQLPNFAVDTSARLGDLLVQDSAKVRQFFIDFQDQIMFGTDFGSNLDPDSKDAEAQRNQAAKLRHAVQNWIDYLSTTKRVAAGSVENRGLELPTAVLEKVFFRNAMQWYPGI